MIPEVLNAILDKIKEYNRIFLFRHIRIDGDCVGSTKGLQEIIRATYPEKEVYQIDDQTSDYLAFMGPCDPEVPDEYYKDALAIALDTGSKDRISSPKFELCKELIKIDHHINNDPYGDLLWVEDERSSACEMVAYFYDVFKNELKITPKAAWYLYTGMVTDSGRFQYPGVTGETMRLAGLLLDQGIDTQLLYAHLYLKEFDSLKFKAYVYDHMTISPNGVASVYISKEVQDAFSLSQEEASTAISFMDSIKGCLSWIAFIDDRSEEGKIRVRLRSRFAFINTVAENHHGGGHACASGATVYSHEEMQTLLNEADEVIEEYKETHENWL